LPSTTIGSKKKKKERVTRLARRWLLGCTLGLFGQEASPLGRFVLFARVCVRLGRHLVRFITPLKRRQRLGDALSGKQKSPL
jgi:hypothetical protein